MWKGGLNMEKPVWVKTSRLKPSWSPSTYGLFRRMRANKIILTCGGHAATVIGWFWQLQFVYLWLVIKWLSSKSSHISLVKIHCAPCWGEWSLVRNHSNGEQLIFTWKISHQTTFPSTIDRERESGKDTEAVLILAMQFSSMGSLYT